MIQRPVSTRFDLARVKLFLKELSMFLHPWELLLSTLSWRIHPSYSASKIWTEWESNLTIWQMCSFKERRLSLLYANGDTHGCCCTTLKKHLPGATLQRQNYANY